MVSTGRILPRSGGAGPGGVPGTRRGGGASSAGGLIPRGGLAEDSLDLLGEGLDVVGLVDESIRPFADERFRGAAIGEPRRDQDREARLDLAKFTHGLEAVHAGHDDVEENDVGPRSRPQTIHGLLTRRGSQHGIPQVAEDLRRDEEYRLFVVDDENGAFRVCHGTPDSEETRTPTDRWIGSCRPELDSAGGPAHV